MKFIALFCWGVAYHEYSIPFTHSFQPQAKLQMFQQVNKEVHERQHTLILPLDRLLYQGCLWVMLRSS